MDTVMSPDTHHSLRLLKALFQQGSIGVAQVDSHSGQFIRLNQKYADILGYSCEELLQTDYQSITPQADLAVQTVYMGQLLAGEIRDFTLEKRYRHKRGHTIWVKLTIQAIWEPGSQPDYHLALIEDITEHKQASVALNLHAVCDEMFEGIQIIDFDFRYLYLNKTAARHGLSSVEKLLGQRMETMYPGIESTEVYGLIQLCLSERTSHHMVNHFEYPDGQKAWFELLITPVPLGAMILSVDISERKYIESDLQRLSLAARHTSNAVVFTNAKREITWVNDGFTKITGYTLDEVLGKKPGELLQCEESDPATIAYMRQQLNQYQPAYCEIINQRKDGSRYMMKVEIQPYFDEQQQLQGFLSIQSDMTDHYETEAKLRQNEALLEMANKKLQLTLAALPDLLFEVDENGVIEYYSAPNEDLLYVPPEQFLGKTITQVLPPESGEVIMAAIQEALLKGHSIGKTYSLPMPHGEDWFELSVAVSPDETSHPKHLILLARNVTARKIAEIETHKTHELNRRIIESLPCGLVHIDKNGSILTANQEAHRILGLSFDELLQRYVTDFHSDTFYEDGSPFPVEEYPFTQALRTGEPQRSVIIGSKKADGPTHWRIYTAIPTFDVDEEISGVVLSFLDISERKHIEAELQRLSMVAHYTSNAVVMTNGQREIIWVNEGFTKLTGYTLAEALGQKPGALLQCPESDPTVIAYIRQQLNQHQPVHCEIINQRKDGSRYKVQMEIQPYFDAHHQLMGYLSIESDITARQAAEDNLNKLNQDLETLVRERTAQLMAQNKALEVFNYAVSHDLKAPLRGIDGYSQFLLEDYADKLDEQGRLFLNNIRQSIVQMNQLIEGMFDYTRLEQSDSSQQVVKWEDLCHEIFQEYEADLAGVELNWQLTADLLWANPVGLTMALRNILGNAIKFTKPCITPQISIASHISGNRHIISIQDNGVGFDMIHHDRIFEMFQRLHRTEEFSGAGVGLAIAKKAIEQMQGRLWAQSVPHQGTCFYLDLLRYEPGFDNRQGISDE